MHNAHRGAGSATCSATPRCVSGGRYSSVGQARLKDSDSDFAHEGRTGAQRHVHRRNLDCRSLYDRLVQVSVRRKTAPPCSRIGAGNTGRGARALRRTGRDDSSPSACCCSSARSASPTSPETSAPCRPPGRRATRAPGRRSGIRLVEGEVTGHSGRFKTNGRLPPQLPNAPGTHSAWASCPPP